MKLYIKSSGYIQTKKPYPYDSPEYEARMQEAADEIRDKRAKGNAYVIVLEPCIYVIFHDHFRIEKYLLDDWGHWGTIFGSTWEHTLDFLKQGGNPDDVTYMLDNGWEFKPYLKSGRLRYTVTLPDGETLDMNANQAEKAYWQSQNR